MSPIKQKTEGKNRETKTKSGGRLFQQVKNYGQKVHLVYVFACGLVVF